MIIYFSVLVAVIGLIAYLAASNTKVAEAGRVAFAMGLLVFLLRLPAAVDVIGR